MSRDLHHTRTYTLSLSLSPPDDDFHELGRRTEGFSGSDCNVVVKDVLMQVGSALGLRVEGSKGRGGRGRRSMGGGWREEDC